MDEKPLVSIQCLVYNHEPFLRQCLDGFVMQKANFKFEAIVHDDCSTDGSVDIICEYAEKYPDIIKPIYESENQYSQGTLREVIAPYLRGQYIALCEGDDFWIDPFKLQKQVNFLEKNIEFGMCFTNFNIYHQSSGKLDLSLLTNKPDKYPCEYTLSEWIVHPGYLGPPTWLVRRELWFKPKIVGVDGTFLLMTRFMHDSKVYCLKNDTTATYRDHVGSITQSMSYRIQYERCLGMYYSKMQLTDLYINDSNERKKIRNEVFNETFNNSNFLKILAYGTEKEIILVCGLGSKLRIENRILALISRISWFRKFFTNLYLYYVHARTGLEV
jgi:glycosyltransferase involved in cell wall biosynthesis